MLQSTAWRELEDAVADDGARATWDTPFAHPWAAKAAATADQGGNGHHGRADATETPDEVTVHYVDVDGVRHAVEPEEAATRAAAGGEVVTERVSTLATLASFRDVFEFFTGTRDTAEAGRRLDGVDHRCRVVGERKVELWTSR
jgi:hypothetical protein